MMTIEEKLRLLASLDESTASVAWLWYLAAEPTERDEVSGVVDLLLFSLGGLDFADAVVLPPPAPHECGGEYSLGEVCYPPAKRHARFGLREHDWIHHVLVVGMTGTGKTTLAFSMLRELALHNKPFLIFDWKRNYRDLLQLDWFSARIYTVGRSVAPFVFNPLIPPPGVVPGEWMMKLVDVILHAYFCGAGVEYIVRRALYVVYEECGYHTGARTSVPTFHQARLFVMKWHLQGRMQLWQASALRVLESLCFPHGLGPVVNRTTPTPTELLGAPLVLELDGLSDADKVFFTEAMILWIYEYRKQDESRETFKHALLIEEAHHVLSEKKEQSEGVETIMETCLRQIREFGEAVIVLDQEPSKLSNSILANTHTKIVFNLGSGRDQRQVGEDHERIPLLGIGEALVSVKGRLRRPVLVRFPNVAVRKGAVTDEHLSVVGAAPSTGPAWRG